MTTHTPKIMASAIAVALFSTAALFTHSLVRGLTSPTVNQPFPTSVEYVLPTTGAKVNNQVKRFEF